MIFLNNKIIICPLGENNAWSSEQEEEERAFNLFIQFLHDLFKLGVWCPGKNTIWEIRISLPQSLSKS